jgi:hypothetical protein
MVAPGAMSGPFCGKISFAGEPRHEYFWQDETRQVSPPQQK